MLALPQTTTSFTCFAKLSFLKANSTKKGQKDKTKWNWNSFLMSQEMTFMVTVSCTGLAWKWTENYSHVEAQLLVLPSFAFQRSSWAVHWNCMLLHRLETQNQRFRINLFYFSSLIRKGGTWYTCTFYSVEGRFREVLAILLCFTANTALKHQ